MRSDIVPGGIFPDYELPDHTGKLRKLSELQGDDPLILTLARGHYCPRSTSSIWSLLRSTPRSRWRTHRSPRSPPTTTTRCRNSEHQSEPSGLSFQTPTERFRRISTSRSTPILRTIR